ncbi:hypothetical protein Acr_10g0003610 [Actinidia rufa]|uniref:Uncharacterized protein n=1 Tax=Actinidia rufa TaxID=165716 RepID=A0A7J0F980_9ERIC|nr:hypothetical protein Acr_10g0003610 [Actinidia rufa]
MKTGVIVLRDELSSVSRLPVPVPQNCFAGLRKRKDEKGKFSICNSQQIMEKIQIGRPSSRLLEVGKLTKFDIFFYSFDLITPPIKILASADVIMQLLDELKKQILVLKSTLSIYERNALPIPASEGFVVVHGDTVQRI